ncbi:MAG: penicillin-binding protein 1C, partial [Synergistaceae bacterium]|nr:penicillin-binding protein 1C [Synergistaceae bacterium]
MKKAFLIIISVFLSAFLILFFSIDVNPERVKNIFGSTAFYDTNDKLFHVRLSPASEWQIPIKLEEMGKWLPLVAVNAEDGRFYSHFGIDFLAMARAVWKDLIRGKIVSGASTITSQVVRMAISEHEGRKRTFSTKIREFLMATKLEFNMTKPEILEAYLNLAPFGGNIRGVQAASLIYFGKSASQISRGEACLLIGMLKSPTLYRPDTKPSAAKKRRDDIIKLMERKKVFTHDEAKRAFLEELPRRKFELPSRAYHYTELILSQNTGSSRKFETTLNLEAQTKLEAILRQSLNDFPSDITLAAGVVDNKTADLVAWVGNARFNYDRNSASSWVDCGRSPRSPGSTLKPFAYACAIDAGDLTPSTLLADTSMAFSGRAPRNFDLQYRGAVTARIALSESLNAPAVRVLRSTGQDKILTLMRQAGLKHLNQSANYYGDSLILGGCDVTVLEELEAFTTLSSLGIHRPLRFLKNSAQPSEKLASSEACYLVSDILRYNGELSLFARGTLGRQWRMALKTGTSYGLRDAWASAWTPDYTVVVWVGNPDGTSWNGLVGARAAAPVATKILRLISPKSTWYEKPENLILRKVCSLSGKPPTALCPSVKFEWAIDGVTKTFPCDMHTIKSGQAVVNLPEGFNEKIRRENLNLKVKRPELAIASPINGASYFAAPFDNERKIPLKSEGASGQVFWYLDGEYIGVSSDNKTFFYNIPDGEHIISASDSDGRTSFVNIKVFTPCKREPDELLLK